MRLYFCLLLIFSLFLLSCRGIVPRRTNHPNPKYNYTYTGLDFERISNAQDTSWHKQVKPLAAMLLSHPAWIIEIGTALPDSSNVIFENRIDVIACKNISQFLLVNGVNPSNLHMKAFHNGIEYKGKKRGKYAFVWRLIKN